MAATHTLDRLGTFFEERAKYRTLGPQLAIMMIAGLAFALDIVVIGLTLGPEARGTYDEMLWVLGILFTAVPLLGWLVSNYVAYLIGNVLGASIKYSIVLRTTGWATIPLIGTGASIALGRYFALRGVDACSKNYVNCSVAAVVPIPDQVSGVFTFASIATSDSVFVWFYAVALGFLLVTTGLWIVALDRSSTLTRAGAAVAVGPSIIAGAVFYTLSVF